MTTKRMPDLIEELSKAATECRELLTELRQERRGLRDDLAALEEHRATFKQMVDDVMDQENMEKVVKDGLREIQDKIDEVSDVKCRQIGAMFDRFTSLLLYSNQQGRGPNVFDEVFKQMKRGEL